MSVRDLLARICLIALFEFLAVTGRADSSSAGRALAADLCARRPVENSEFSGILKIRNGKGNRTQIPIKFQILTNTIEWRAIYATRSPAGTEKLTVIHAPDQANTYLYEPAGRGAIAGATPNVLRGEQAGICFAGSDFWLSDLGTEFLHWPDQRLLRSEMRKGRPCKVLESLNPQPEPGQYSKVISWVDTESGGLVAVEAYDHTKRLLKVFTVKSLNKVKGEWQVKKMEIRNEASDSLTQIDFDLAPP